MITYLLFFSLNIFAADFSFNGQASYEPYLYWQDLPAPTRKYDHVLHFRPELELKGPNDRIVLKTPVRANPSTDDDKEKVFVNFQEAYWEYTNYPVRTRLGMNTFSWGLMDGYSPLDITNSRVFFNPLSSEKLGSPALDIKYEGDGWSAQAIYIVKQPRSVLPSTDSRWLPRELLINPSTTEGTILLPPTFNYTYPATVELNDSRDHNFGIKLTKRLSTLDLSAVAFEGNSATPQFDVFLNGTVVSTIPLVIQATSDIELVPVYYRQRTFGAQITWAPSSFIVRLENAYTDNLSEATALPGWSNQTAFGIEKQFYLGSTSLTTILQGYYGQNDDLKDNLVSSGPRIFDKAALVGLRFGFSTRTSLLLSTMYDISSNSYFIHSNFSSKLSESWTYSAILEFIEGSEDSLIGSYNNNDRLVFNIGYNW